jgi:magnesium-transporting ATPase (P-type)
VLLVLFVIDGHCCCRTTADVFRNIWLEPAAIIMVMAILTIIGGIILLLGAESFIAVGTLISVAPHTANTAANNSHGLTQFFGVISAAIGSVLLVIGIGYLQCFTGY